MNRKTSQGTQGMMIGHARRYAKAETPEDKIRALTGANEAYAAIERAEANRRAKRTAKRKAASAQRRANRR